MCDRPIARVGRLKDCSCTMSVYQQQIGELASLATAVLWTLSAVAWTSAGKRIGALAVVFCGC